MNVGSILNNDSPPSSKEDTPPKTEKAVDHPQEKRVETLQEQAQDAPSSHQRHSIVNILNETPSSKQFPQNISPIVSHQTLRKNNILNITNDKDVDITTGKETSVNASRHSSVSEAMNDSANESRSDINQSRDEGNEIKVKIPTKKERNSSPSLSPQQNHPSNGQNGQKVIKTEDDLKKIKQIKSKPRRYQVPPIWAQEYRPKGKGNYQYQQDVYANGNTQPNVPDAPQLPFQSHLTDKRALNNTTTPSVDLECSISGIIPTSSMIKTISSWIFANFKNIAEENRKYVELELKFGRIIDKTFGKRVKLDITSDCVYTNHTGSHFDMQIDEVAWNEVQKFLSELETSYQNELKRSKNPNKKPARKFNTLDSDMTDSFYQISERNSKSKSVRVSKDNTLTPPRYAAITKTRIGDLYIYNPSGIYDLRLSLSLELPVPDESIENIRNRNVPRLVREKKRNSWVHAPTITRFDLTRVLMPLESKNKSGKTIVTHEKKFEVELEIDTLELFSAIEKVDKGSDMFRFQELVEIFMNNARVLNNRVSSLARSD